MLNKPCYQTQHLKIEFCRITILSQFTTYNMSEIKKFFAETQAHVVIRSVQVSQINGDSCFKQLLIDFEALHSKTAYTWVFMLNLIV